MGIGREKRRDLRYNIPYMHSIAKEENLVIVAIIISVTCHWVVIDYS